MGKLEILGPKPKGDYLEEPRNKKTKEGEKRKRKEITRREEPTWPATWLRV
jgi:hypothetical protein